MRHPTQTNPTQVDFVVNGFGVGSMVGYDPALPGVAPDDLLHFSPLLRAPLFLLPSPQVNQVFGFCLAQAAKHTTMWHVTGCR